ncbi:MAG: hypothetical protein Ct9H300mP23_01070 [Nitrospinota bacterium]|nr:MAG: hypothetical protein Ct9H300mP23_01070 [Nitrospinota bacterium]
MDKGSGHCKIPFLHEMVMYYGIEVNGEYSFWVFSGGKTNEDYRQQIDLKKNSYSTCPPPECVGDLGLKGSAPIS